ncbi:MAG: protein-L-isoaspartate(D-aspartate) O-methyltransferase [Planctomycetota bacterium]|nr:protein-L-isoaspartate(D-aspartate) O-methyltransferase [Planctomycetota bacterium]
MTHGTATRADMLERILASFRETAGYTGRAKPHSDVLTAMRRVPREQFVQLQDRAYAYENRPLPIGHGQTISQPFIVALMADLVDPTPEARVLEVGTGCGYAAAVMSLLVAEVHTLETVSHLATSAADRLHDLGYDNVHVQRGDGYDGWPEAAPYDAIVVTAAAPAVPEALVEQLAAPGIMVAPIGRMRTGQQLVRITKSADGEVSEAAVLPVAFVPMVRNGTRR